MTLSLACSLNDFVVEIVTKAKKAEEARDRKEACILTVPIAIVGESTKFYHPTMVSFGPYHNYSPQYHGKKIEASLTEKEKERRKQLDGMESDKLLATRRFWKLTDDQDHKGKLQAMVEVCDRKKVTDKYDRDLSHIKTKKIAQMCFVDVAFLLEFLNTFVMGFNRVDGSGLSITIPPVYSGWDDASAQVSSSNPVFYERSNNPVLFTILMDVMKVENQLPMVVLEKAMEVTGKRPLLEDLLRHLCCHISPIKSQSPRPCRSTLNLIACKHLLDCLRLTLVSKDSWLSYKKHLKQASPISESSASDCDFRSPVLKFLYCLLSPCLRKKETPEISDERYLPYGAEKLKKAGVVFKAMDHGGIHDISFDQQTGTLLLPEIDVGVWTETIFRNLLAYEACYKSGSSELLEMSSDEDQKVVTRFVLFMSQLVETEKDADVLREEKIIQNNLGDSKEVARMWNDMNSSRWIPKCNQFDEITRELNGYIGQQWVVWFAEIWEEYFSKPWLVLAVIIAVIVFAETLVSLWSSLKGNN
ncbi:hypothetical protein SUGI_0705490 [Cryptomeria japonica]|uniref:uncharacterized protein LOC131028428 n=1 Tax=Cryptomeria japonica TaxID=3369 RepID=UPI002414A817|nr:uncharacterized protein LOC131028428 [Cryptomeria japonica]XP_057814671.2 uncharacterized protein LOC131028429 [Cryptomeria japonica]GLJ35056.1 hypothetical protein SUGI_0705450 [Cryptomeria japonica]GLJ35060.1 hypothetical protein SUGI_0705490 [Cryptomeria japonica]